MEEWKNNGNILDHGWPESITSQARSAQHCRMRSFSLREAFVKQARDSTRQGALRIGLRKLLYASCTVQVARRKLLRASCSVQVGPCKWLPASCSVQIAPCKLLPASCSLQVALCKLLCASCSVQVALCKLLCVSCSAQVALGKALCENWSVQVGLRKLLCATCSAQVALRKLLYASCILRRPPADAGPGSRRANHETTPEDQFEQQKLQKNEFLYFDYADFCRGLCEYCRNCKTSSFCTLTTPIPAEGWRGSADDTTRKSTRCGDRRGAKTRVFLRFLKFPHDRLRGSAWSRCKNSRFFAISKAAARPSAGIGVVEVQKLEVFCNF